MYEDNHVTNRIVAIMLRHMGKQPALNLLAELITETASPRLEEKDWARMYRLACRSNGEDSVSIFGMNISLVPEMTVTGTAEGINGCELYYGGQLFKFQGPGWYINPNGSTILIHPVGEHRLPWIANRDPHAVFKLLYWPPDRSIRNMVEVFQQVATAPVFNCTQEANSGSI